MPRDDPRFGMGALQARLVVLENATYPRRREETLPEPRVPYPRREILEDLRCSGERLPRLLGLPAPLVQLADLHPDLPQFAWQTDLLGESFGLSQLGYGTLGIAFPLAEDRKGAKVGHPIPPVRLRALGESADLLSGEFFVPSSQERLDFAVEVEAEQRVEEHANLVSPPGVDVGVLPVLREGGQHAIPGVGKHPVVSYLHRLVVGRACLLQVHQRFVSL